jgi:hypothetical protein
MAQPALAPLWLRRIAWLLVIWTTSVAALAAFAGAFRLLMMAAGLAG